MSDKKNIFGKTNISELYTPKIVDSSGNTYVNVGSTLALAGVHFEKPARFADDVYIDLDKKIKIKNALNPDIDAITFNIDSISFHMPITAKNPITLSDHVSLRRDDSDHNKIYFTWDYGIPGGSSWTLEKNKLTSPSGGVIKCDTIEINTIAYHGGTPPWVSVESDPIFSASAAASISTGDKLNWNTAYSWGDHSLAGYLTSVPSTIDHSIHITSGDLKIGDVETIGDGSALKVPTLLLENPMNDAVIIGPKMILGIDKTASTDLLQNGFGMVTSNESGGYLKKDDIALNFISVVYGGWDTEEESIIPIPTAGITVSATENHEEGKHGSMLTLWSTDINTDIITPAMTLSDEIDVIKNIKISSKIGFFENEPVDQPVVDDTGTLEQKVDSLIDALVTLGLINVNYGS